MAALTPEKLAASGTESGQQRALFMWSVMQYAKWPELKWMYSVPNGGGRSMSQAAVLKAEGLKSGISDVCLPLSRKGYHGLYIEMKKPSGGEESENQIAFGKFLTDNCYLYRCCHTFEEARDTVSWYMS